jgi:hypothetical protein
VENAFSQNNSFTAIQQNLLRKSSLPVEKNIVVPQIPLTGINLHALILAIQALDQNGQSDEFISNCRRNLRDIALVELFGQFGSNFIQSSAFQVINNSSVELIDV